MKNKVYEDENIRLYRDNKDYEIKTRDPARIPLLLLKLCALWEMYPDWRFGQLVENIIVSYHDNHIGVCGVENDLWHWEDEQWEAAILKMGEKINA